MADMLKSMARNGDLPYRSSLGVYTATVEAKTARETDEVAVQKAQLLHEARLLALAVALRQLYTDNTSGSAVWKEAGLVDVIKNAYTGRGALSSNSSALDAVLMVACQAGCD
jgi:hypothetical protein